MKARAPLDCQAVPLADGKGKITIGELREEAGFAGDAPLDSITTLDYADKFGLTRWVAAAELKKLVAAGKLSVGRKAVKSEDGRRILKKAYWPA
jgi:hypothetical protein